MGGGLPIGTLAFVPANSPGWIDLGYETVHGVLVETYPALATAKYCGDKNNATAGWYYRSDDAAGTQRNIAGQWFILPGLKEYFIRAGVADYILHQDQMQRITGYTGVQNTGAGNFGNIWGGAFASTADYGTTVDALPATQLSGVYPIIKFDSALVARSGDETTPKHIYENIAIKAYDTATNAEAVDIAYVINALQALQAEKVDRSEFTGSNQDLSQAGYQKLPGGMIWQWGELTGSGSGDVRVNFQIPFQSEAIAALSTRHGGGSGPYFAMIGAHDNTGMSIGTYQSNTGSRVNAVVDYIVIGF